MLDDATPVDPSRISPGKSLEPQSSQIQPRATFESYMQGKEQATPGAMGKAAPLSGTQPFATTAPIQTGPPSIDTILTQTKHVQDSLGTVSQQLSTQNLKLKRSQSHLLKTKLQDASEAIRDSASKLDLQNPEMKFPSAPGPMSRFLAYVGDGQDRLMAVQNELKSMSSAKGGVSPAKILYIQVKINQAQQEIDYATTLLSKVIDSLKTILNTQL